MWVTAVETPPAEKLGSIAPALDLPSLLILQVNMLWPLHVPLLILAW